MSRRAFPSLNNQATQTQPTPHYTTKQHRHHQHQTNQDRTQNSTQRHQTNQPARPTSTTRQAQDPTPTPRAAQEPSTPLTANLPGRHHVARPLGGPRLEGKEVLSRHTARPHAHRRLHHTTAIATPPSCIQHSSGHTHHGDASEPMSRKLARNKHSYAAAQCGHDDAPCLRLRA